MSLSEDVEKLIEREVALRLPKAPRFPTVRVTVEGVSADRKTTRTYLVLEGADYAYAPTPDTGRIEITKPRVI